MATEAARTAAVDEDAMFMSVPSQTLLSEPLDLENPNPGSISRAILRRLYLSHTLSTLNSRVFEFGAVLYLASIFPNTLLPLSIYAMTRSAASIVLGPAVGKWIDQGDRLKIVRTSIVYGRSVVTISCAMFLLLERGLLAGPLVQIGLLAVLAMLACVEKLCWTMNLVAVERDWAVVIAADNEVGLRSLNAQMRRIDLICKLGGPFAIALIDGLSTEAAILVNLTLNIISIPVEYFAIAKVYNLVPALQKQKSTSDEAPAPGANNEPRIRYWSQHFTSGLATLWKPLKVYFHQSACLPSFALSLLYFTVLSFSGQMVTYLISAGYTSMQVGIARTLSVLFEISSTWLSQILLAKIGPVRGGIWFLNLQLLSLAIGVAIFWWADNRIIAASGLVGGTILSRIGLWGFDSSVQLIVQEVGKEPPTKIEFLTNLPCT